MLRGMGRFTLAGLMALAGAAFQTSACDLLWQVASPLPTGNQVAKVAYGNSTFVGVGNGGDLETSADGVTWRRQCSPASHGFLDITFGNSAFVATSGAYRYFLLHVSADGVVWQTYSLDTPEHRVLFTRFLFAGGYFLGIDSAGIYRSADGVHWVVIPTGQVQLQDIAYGKGTYVAVDTGGHFYTSPDASTWTAHTFPYPGQYSRVLYGGGAFVTVASGPSSVLILTSQDAQGWTLARYSPNVNTNCVALYGGGRFVLISGWDGMWSEDGATWSNFDVYPHSLQAASWARDAFMAVDQYGDLLVSPDGVTWEDRSAGVLQATPLKLIASDSPRQFVAVGAGGFTATSPDGRTWTSTSVRGDVTFLDVASGGGHLAAVGPFGAIFSSDDGTTWRDASVGGAVGWLRGVAYGAGTFVAVGDTGVMFTSPDGAAWTPRDPGYRQTLDGIAYGGGRFVAVGEGSTLLTSTDGVAWTGAQSPNSGVSYSSVCFGNGVFLVGSNSPYLLVGSDGLQWQQVPIMGSATTVVFAGGSFYRRGYTTAATSPDGITWTDIPPGLGGITTGPASDGSVYVAVGGAQQTQPVFYWAEACFPVLSAVDVDTLPTAGGTVVTLTGSFFSGATAVRFGDAPSADFTVVSDTTITAVAPPHAAGLAPVTVTTPGGTSRTGADTTAVYGERPAILAVKKVTSPFRLKVTGSGFDSHCIVLINGAAAPSTRVKNSGVILAQGGTILKSRLPKKTAAQIVVLNTWTGVSSHPYTFTP